MSIIIAQYLQCTIIEDQETTILHFCLKKRPTKLTDLSKNITNASIPLYLWLKHVAVVSCYVSQTGINGYYWRFVGSEMWDDESPVARHSMELNRTEQTKKTQHFPIKIISRVGRFCNLFICDPHPVVSCPTGAAVSADGRRFPLAWQCSGLVFILFNVNHHVVYIYRVMAHNVISATTLWTEAMLQC